MNILYFYALCYITGIIIFVLLCFTELYRDYCLHDDIDNEEKIFTHIISEPPLNHSLYESLI